jgi:hypothetical protein
MNSGVTRAGRRLLLVAASAMVLNTACSHAPGPGSAPEPAPASPGRIMARVYTTDGTLYVTSRYNVTDSCVVIEEILRGDEFYADPNEAHLYQKPDSAKEPPADLTPPVSIPLDQVRRIEPALVASSAKEGQSGWLLPAGLILGIALTLVSVIALSGWGN